MRGPQKGINMFALRTLQAGIVLALATSLGAPHAAAQARTVVINDVRLSDQDVQALEMRFRTQIPDGNFWYDQVSGAWGTRGGPIQGFTLPGLAVGGSLKENASNGNMPVWINGRRLHYIDVIGLQRMLGTVYPGRYWVDAQGNAGYEGGPALVNLLVIARQRSGNRSGGGGSSSWYSKDGNTMFGSDGNGCLVFSSKDASSYSTASVGC